MTKISRFQAACVTVFVLTFFSINVFSQEAQSQVQPLEHSQQESTLQLSTSQLRTEQATPPQDFFTFGLSFHQVLPGRFFSLRLTPMFSAMYSHKFTPWFELEAALHFTGRSAAQYGSFGGGFVSQTQTGDMTAMFTPFAGSVNGLERLRIGGGISLQSNSLAGTGIVPNTQGVFEVRDIISSYRQWGAHLKVDYLVPLSNNLDLGLRAQVHLLGVPTAIQGNYPAVLYGEYTPSLSVGGFIRFGW